MPLKDIFYKPRFWLEALRDPALVWLCLDKEVWQYCRIALTRPEMYRIIKSVDGLISLYLGAFLYDTVLRTRHGSPHVVEVGAYKGLSTVYLSLAAKQTGRRVKSFELFSGLPASDPVLDPGFRPGQFAAAVEEYEANVSAYGCRDCVDLVIGDARETMLTALGAEGFSVAFLDVDVYAVMRPLLEQLRQAASGGEIVVVHDLHSPGVRKALTEFCRSTGNRLKIKRIERSTAVLQFPRDGGNR